MTLADLLTEPDNLHALTDDQLLAVLGQVAERLGPAQQVVDLLYSLRLAVYREARDRPLTHQAIAAAAGVTEVAVIQALRKAKAKEAKTA